MCRSRRFQISTKLWYWSGFFLSSFFADFVHRRNTIKSVRSCFICAACWSVAPLYTLITDESGRMVFRLLYSNKPAVQLPYFLQSFLGYSVSADPHKGINRLACARPTTPFCNSRRLKQLAPLFLVVTRVNYLPSLRCHSVHRNCTSKWLGPSWAPPSTLMLSTAFPWKHTSISGFSFKLYKSARSCVARSSHVGHQVLLPLQQTLDLCFPCSSIDKTMFELDLHACLHSQIVMWVLASLPSKQLYGFYVCKCCPS